MQMKIQMLMLMLMLSLMLMLMVMYVLCIVKFTVAVGCVCPRCCSVELAQRYIFPLLGTGPVVLSHLSQTLLSVWIICAQVCWSTVHILVY